MPTRIVDAVQRGYSGKGAFEGHVFVDVLVGGRWVTTDPLHGRVVGNGYHIITPNGHKIEFVPFARGIDFASMHLTSTEAIRKRAARVMGR